MAQAQNTSFQSESTGSQADAEVSVAPGTRSNLTAEQPNQAGGQGPLRLDQPPTPEYPYTELRPEARSAVTPDDPGALVGDDATATFDNGPSNPTDRASSEALSAATAPARDAAALGIEEDMRVLNTEDADPDTD